VNDLQMARRVGHAMRKLGWIRKRETHGARGYFYDAPADAPAAALQGPGVPPAGPGAGAATQVDPRRSRPDDVPF